jgi:hypothetical protein
MRREEAEKEETEEKNPDGERGIPIASRNASAASRNDSAASRRAGICGRRAGSASGASAWPPSSLAMAHRNQVIIGRQSRTKNSWRLTKPYPVTAALSFF